MRRHLLRHLAVVLALSLTATNVSAQDRPQIVAVNYPLQYLADRLVGEAADVVFPVPAEVDPSFWRPSIADISTIQSADLILLNGAGFATWVDRVSLPRSKVVNTSAAIKDQFIVTESITHSHGDGGEHSHEGLASYLWLDPTLAAAQARAVAAGIKRAGILPSDDIDARLDALEADLDQLDQAARSALANLGDVAIIATHPRYQYFARRYGLTVTALEWETGAMPSAAQLSSLETLVGETGAELLMWEGQPPDAALDAVAELGLASVVFPPLAHRASSMEFDQAFSEAVRSLAAAAE